jgi:phage baseplate assembly protein W
MAITRADTLTGSKKKTEYFSDFMDNFDKSYYGNQLAKVTNEKSVSQSIKNLIFTNLGERPFQPNIGSDVSTLLFEPNFSDTTDTIEKLIRNCIEINEPRAILQEINFPEQTDEQSLEITIVYQVINNPEPINLTLVLKRVR